MSTTPKPGKIWFRYFLVLWLLFFSICFGLGYPTLKRYDPRQTDGLSDVWKYHALATGEDRPAFKELFRSRILVPYVARPFYWFARSYLHSFDPGFFGLLVSNSLFCAMTACLIVGIGIKVFNDPGTALLGATLYLLSFSVPNLQLAGMVDAGEACFMAAVVWSLFTGRWYLLPLWGVLGALAKETFVPFSFVFALTWWFVEGRQYRLGLSAINWPQLKWSRLRWAIVLGIVGLATVMTVHSLVAQHFRWPWEIAGEASAGVNVFVALWRCLTERSFWYVFGWLLPLGIWRLKAFPKPWCVAAIATGIFAIMLGAYSNAGGTVGRATFNIVGPLLSLSVALLIARPQSAGAGPPS